MLLHKLK